MSTPSFANTRPQPEDTEQSGDFLQNLVEAATNAAMSDSTTPASAADPATWIARSYGKRSKLSHGVEDHSKKADVERYAGKISPALSRPSGKPKKQTRPPISSMYDSLQLSPEHFLDLLNAAKGFMLDPQHPQRSNCIGTRDQAESKGIKLELSKNVLQFLEQGNGMRFFGQHTKGPTPAHVIASEAVFGKVNPSIEDEPQNSVDSRSDNDETKLKRSLTWPDDKTTIVRLCLPLFRRVVSNEKQRVYALNSRKPSKDTNDDLRHLSGQDEVSVTGAEQRIGKVRIFFLDDGKLQKQNELDLDDELWNWNALQNSCSRHDFVSEKVTVQTAAGCIRVTSHATWHAAIKSVLETPWLEQTVRVIVESKEQCLPG